MMINTITAAAAAAAATLGAVLAVPPGSPTPQLSDLWGEAGERWQPDRPLRDFSFAGYRRSEVPIPDIPISVNVRRFGARGDGRTDDTEALRRAIAACPPGGKVFLPPGAYVVADLIEVSKSVVIAGAGMDRTRLLFPKFLADLHPRMGATTTGIPTPLWSWSGGFIEFQHTKEAGIEDLTFQFPEIAYRGHFKERGSNGVNFQNVHDAWARRLRFVNADSGIFIVDSHNVTVRQIAFDAYPGRGIGVDYGSTGHHAIDFVTSTRCLADRIHFHVRLFHELGIEHGAHGNVYMRCSGPDLALDHHEPDVYGNLWTDIDVGKGDFVWLNNCRGSTRDEVYWNIRSQKSIPYPKPALNNIVVGMTGPGTEIRNPSGPWVEVIPPEHLAPENLFQAQLEKRIGAEKAHAVLED